MEATLKLLFKKGDLVTIKTTNGGEITTKLWCNHYSTYDAVIETGDVIPCYRIKSIEAAVALPVDISTITEYGLEQKLSNQIRCF